MAQAPHPTQESAHDTAHTPSDVASRRRAWEFFLKSSKWFALYTLGLVFFLIFWLIGGAPLVPTFVIMAVALFTIGAIFH